MIGLLFYLCPVCAGEDCLTEQKDFLHCRQCQQTFPFINNQVDHNGDLFSISDFYTLLKKRLRLYPSQSDPGLRLSKRAVLRQGIKKIRFRAADGHISIIEKPVEVDTGILRINQEALIFEGLKNHWIFPKDQIQAYTTNSKYFEFKVKDVPFFQILFDKESPLKYEDLLTKWYMDTHDSPDMLEHQPRIVFDQPASPTLLLSHETIEKKRFKERFSISQILLHLFIGLPLISFIRWRTGLIYQNHALIPEEGPFVLIMNHESYLDPILISTLSSRRIAFFTKSTSFADRFLQPVFRAYHAIPNRRYEIDPIVVRQGIRRLRQGGCIGIFPEGERTWDGKLLPFKYNTIRFLLSAQVPIVIVKIHGAFSLLPRWSHRLRHGAIRIEVQQCLSLLPGRWGVADLKNMLESNYMQTEKVSSDGYVQ